MELVQILTKGHLDQTIAATSIPQLSSDPSYNTDTDSPVFHLLAHGLTHNIMGCGGSKVDSEAKTRNEAIESQLKKDRMNMRYVRSDQSV